MARALWYGLAVMRVLLAMLCCACQAVSGGTPSTRASQEGAGAPPAIELGASSAQRPEVVPLTSGVPAQSATPSSSRELAWDFPDAPLGATRVVVRVPPGAPPSGGFPVLVTFHGRGETLRGPVRGARGWLDDYRLGDAIHSLAHPPLVTENFGGMVTQERLARLNGMLEQRAFRDLVVVMPYVPDRFKRDALFTNGPIMANFIVDQVLSRVQQELPASRAPRRTAVDGVSLGGRVALLVGLSRPEAFHVVAATQAAIDEKELRQLGDLVQTAIGQNSTLKLRLLTSHEDYYLGVVRHFSEELRTRNVDHRLDIVSGNHSYGFNRGPGAIEMLTYHSWALWSE